MPLCSHSYPFFFHMLVPALLLLWLLPTHGLSAPTIPSLDGHCPCSSPSLCKARKAEKHLEVFGFCPGTKHFQHYDFTHLTTLAWVEHEEAMCFAHSRRARVVLDSRPDIMPALLNSSAQPSWVQDQVNKALGMHMDGINFDLEDPATLSSPLSLSYVDIVRSTAAAFHDQIPGSQVSVDIPWSPFDVDGRNYDWAGLAAAADILFVMSYDMQSQIYGKCVAAANSPAHLVAKGLHQWLDLLGLPRHKVVLGLPWYGYDYPCQPDASGRPLDPLGEVCHLQAVPFRGAPCSDAAGSQKDYQDIMQVLASGSNTTAVRWDPNQQSPYFNYKAADGSMHQVWFDNPESLSIKYKMAADLGLRGVGIWHVESLDYESADPRVMQETAAMWGALEAFTDGVTAQPGRGRG